MKLDILIESRIAQYPLNTQGYNWEKKIKEMRALPELGGDKEVRPRIEKGGVGAGQKWHKDPCATLGTPSLHSPNSALAFPALSPRGQSSVPRGLSKKKGVLAQGSGAGHVGLTLLTKTFVEQRWLGLLPGPSHCGRQLQRQHEGILGSAGSQALPRFRVSQHKKGSLTMGCWLEAGTPSPPMVLNLMQMPTTLKCVFPAQTLLPSSRVIPWYYTLGCVIEISNLFKMEFATCPFHGDKPGTEHCPWVSPHCSHIQPIVVCYCAPKCIHFFSSSRLASWA